MRIRFILLFIAASTFSVISVCAQNALNAGSNSALINNEVYEYAIGEMTLVSTVQTTEVILTQGFLQPQLIVEKLAGTAPAGQTGLPDNINVYPNPTENVLFIEYVSDEPSFMSYHLYDAAGRLIINKTEQQVEGINKFKLDVSSFAAGAYFLMIKRENGNNASLNFTYKIQKIQ